jgi:predicted ATPase
MLHALSVRGYRSIQAIDLPLAPVTVVVGANGAGKTNLYRALYLLHAAARGELARTIADEGGMQSLLWAGERKKGPVRTGVSIRFDPVEYELELGLPARAPTDPTAFVLDPVVKSDRARSTAASAR